MKLPLLDVGKEFLGTKNISATKSNNQALSCPSDHFTSLHEQILLSHRTIIVDTTLSKQAIGRDGYIGQLYDLRTESLGGFGIFQSALPSNLSSINTVWKNRSNQNLTI